MYYFIKVLSPNKTILKKLILTEIPIKDNESRLWICKSYKGEEIKFTCRSSIDIIKIKEDELEMYESFISG